VTTDDAAPQSYSLKSVREMLGLSAGTLSRLIDAGFVTPARGPRNEYRFSFQDVVLLRTANQLLSARIPPRKVVLSLAALRKQLPDRLPLTGLRISAVGNEVAVREGGVQWNAQSKQMLMDFEVAPAGAAVAFIAHERETPAEPAPAPCDAPEAQLEEAQALERRDPKAAEAAYRALIVRTEPLTEAYLNLGALLYESGRLNEALAIYEQGLSTASREPRLHYNRALALEDLQRIEEALSAYETCLRIEADFADAHYNAARLYEQLGNSQLALRHFSAYRRLQR
jgi:tetratricopeptide (TPR) repeat protein